MRLRLSTLRDFSRPFAFREADHIVENYMPLPGFLYQCYSDPSRLVVRGDFNVTAGAYRAVDALPKFCVLRFDDFNENVSGRGPKLAEQIGVKIDRFKLWLVHSLCSAPSGRSFQLKRLQDEPPVTVPPIECG